MPRISNFELLKQIEQPTITIRTRTTIQNIPMLIGQSYEKLGEYLKELGELITDMPFIAYHNMDMQDLDVEIGFPVSKPLPGRDDMKPSAIPEGRVVTCMYLGRYSDMEPVYCDMVKWIEDNGYEPVGTSYEYYYNSPDFPESQWLTKIVMAIK